MDFPQKLQIDRQDMYLRGFYVMGSHDMEEEEKGGMRWDFIPQDGLDLWNSWVGDEGCLSWALIFHRRFIEDGG